MTRSRACAALRWSSLVGLLPLAIAAACAAAAPKVTAVSPTTCLNTVSSVNTTVTGTGFVTGATVRLRLAGQPDILATGASVIGTTTITCKVNPLGAAAGAWDVVVTNTDGQSGTLPGGLTINNPAPGKIALSPSSTYAGGPDFTLTVSGSSFVFSSTVHWNGSPRPTTFVSSSSLTAIISAADLAVAGIVPVTVVNPAPGGGTSAAKNFTANNYPVPAISALSPSYAFAPGEQFILTVTGSSFVSTSTVHWGGSPRATTYGSATRLTAIITAEDIASPGTVAITVVNPAPGGGASGSLNFTTYNPIPTVTTITPNTGTNDGTVDVSLSGSGFMPGLSITLTKTGQTPLNATGVSVLSENEVTCRLNLVGATTGAWAVVVTNPDSLPLTNSNAFTVYNPSPTLTSLTPNTGLNNNVRVTGYVLRGTGFRSGSAVTLTRAGHTPIEATAENVLSDTEMTCSLQIATATSTGAWNAVVTNANTNPGNGSATLLDGFTVYAYAAPTVEALTPGSGYNNGSVSLTNLAGTGFRSGATVRVQRSGQPDITATNVTVVNATKITGTLDLTGAAAGPWDVVVTNADGQTGTLAGGFAVLQANAITGPRVSQITNTTAMVHWSTILPSSTNVGYGTEISANYAAYPNHGFGVEGVTDHELMLAGLQPDTTYYLCVQSTSAAPTIESSTISFTTLREQLPPTLTYTGVTTGSTTTGGMVTLAATLTHGETGLSGKPVAFVCENFAATATTNSSGVASVPVAGLRLGTGRHAVTCRFAGDASYSPAQATGTITLSGVSGTTILRGAGYFYKGGDRSQRCTFSFRFNVDLIAGWLLFNEAGLKKWISVNVVKTITVNGSQVTVVCGPQDQYTLVIDVDTEAFSLTEGAYAASTTRANGQIVLEEETAP